MLWNYEADLAKSVLQQLLTVINKYSANIYTELSIKVCSKHTELLSVLQQSHTPIKGVLQQSHRLITKCSAAIQIVIDKCFLTNTKSYEQVISTNHTVLSPSDSS